MPPEPADSVVLLRLPHLPLPLLLLYVCAQLAHFRQRKTKGDCAHPKKKTAKRKGSAVDAPVQEESPVASEAGGHVGGGDACRSAWCSDTPDGAGAAQVRFLSVVCSCLACPLLLVTCRQRSVVCSARRKCRKKIYFALQRGLPSSRVLSWCA